MDQPSLPATGRSDLQRAAILLCALLQILATMLPSIGIGEPIGERSDAVRTAITPAGWAFSIWGPLFAGSLAFAVYQLLPGQRRNPLLAAIGWPAAGAFLGNGAWAVYTQFEGLQAPSALIILLTLACLLACYRRFAEWPGGFSAGERWLAVLPLSALAAWLTAATIVNIAAVLDYYGLALGEATSLAAAGVVLLGGIIAAAAIWSGRGNPWFAIVFLWALAGIYGASARDHGEVAAAAIGAAVIVAATTLVRLARPGDRGRWFSDGQRAPSRHAR